MKAKGGRDKNIELIGKTGKIFGSEDRLTDRILSSEDSQTDRPASLKA